jgi:hypothetical protein
MLTDTAIKARRSQKKLYKVSDPDGMYVVVHRRARSCSDTTTASMDVARR